VSGLRIRQTQTGFLPVRTRLCETGNGSGRYYKAGWLAHVPAQLQYASEANGADVKDADVKGAE
jgi:hypothetical protein